MSRRKMSLVSVLQTHTVGAMDNDRGLKIPAAKTLEVYEAARRDRTNTSPVNARQDRRVQQSSPRIHLIHHYQDRICSKHILPDQTIGGGHRAAAGNPLPLNQEGLHVGHRPKSIGRRLAQPQISRIDQGHRKPTKSVQAACQAMAGGLLSHRRVGVTAIRNDGL